MRSSHVLRVMLAVALVCPGTGQAQSLQSAPAAPVSPTDPAPAATTRQHLIKFNGEVRDALGQPRTGVVGITFALYAEQEGGAPLWLETQNVQLDAQGRYTVLLGATQSEGLPLDLFATGAARWLGLQVEVQQEQPRVLLVSVPYALKAKEAERLAGKSASEFLLVQDWQAQMQQEIQTQLQQGTKQQLAFPGIQPQAIIETGRSTFTDTSTSEVVFVEQLGTGRGLRATSAGNLGIVGQSSAASGASTGLRGTSTTSTVGAGLEGFANSPTGFTSGVKGNVQSTQGTGVSGLALATTGTNFGVRGVSLSASGTGVLGRATATSGIARGVQGDTASPTGFGVFGLATDTTGNTTGVFGEVRSAGGTAGVFNNTAGGKLLSGTASGTEVFSLDSSGNLSADGTLSAGAGNFTVDASGNVTATAFVGDGSGLTSLPAGTGDITSVNTAAGSGLSGGATSGDANLSLLTSCGANQLLKWDGASSWACATDIDTNSGGTVTSVTAGDASITIGGTATDPTVALAANSVDSSKIVDGTITSADIADGSIVDADISGSAAIAPLAPNSRAPTPR